MESTKVKAAPESRSRSVAYVGLAVAIMAVASWITVPIGPVPFTLQVFAFVFAIVLLTPKDAMAAYGGYLLLGAVGIPVFSGMRGGIGILAGPTGGFLWASLLGVAASSLLLWYARKRSRTGLEPLAVDVAAGLLFVAIGYVGLWLQFMVVANVDPMTAFLTACAPFALLDCCKVVVASLAARAVRKAMHL